MPASTPGKCRQTVVQLIDTILFIESLRSPELARTVLNRPKFDRYIDGVRRDAISLAFMHQASRFVEIRRIDAASAGTRRTTSSSIVAVNGGADLIVTGDADLLVLHPFEGVEIVTPAAYIARTAG